MYWGSIARFSRASRLPEPHLTWVDSPQFGPGETPISKWRMPRFLVLYRRSWSSRRLHFLFEIAQVLPGLLYTRRWLHEPSARGDIRQTARNPAAGARRRGLHQLARFGAMYL